MRTLTRVTAKNFLSFQDIEVTLSDLTVLVGPNGAGKSNFLNIFRFIGEIARSDLAPAIETLGGLDEVAFRGPSKSKIQRIQLSLEGLMTKHATTNALDQYKLTFYLSPIRTGRNDGYLVRQEELILKRKAGRGRRITLSGQDVEVFRIGDRGTDRSPLRQLRLKVQEASSGLAILRRLGRDYEAPQVEELASIFEDLRLFDVNVTSARRASRTSNQTRLRPDGANLAAFLNWLKHEYPEQLELIREDVAYILPGFRDFEFVPLGGADEAVRVDIVESNLRGTTPLARASFGTVRAIALFAMLHDPSPPRLTCLEEVDHGLHPHALDRLVERLREASKKTQIIVATHSPALVNRITADELIVFERDGETGATRQPDLSTDEIRQMEEESGYRLGELWFSGLIGGNL